MRETSRPFVRSTQRLTRSGRGQGETGDDDFFVALVARAPDSEALKSDLSRAVGRGATGVLQLRRLAGNLAGAARPQPRRCRRRALRARFAILPAVIDLEEAYQRILRAAPYPGDPASIAMDLIGEPNIKAGVLRHWMQIRRVASRARRRFAPDAELADEAAANLAGASTLDIPDPIKKIECRIAPTHDGSIYLHRSGGGFLSAGPDVVGRASGIDTFSTWKEVTTVYHEGVPGHHLQIAQNAYRSELLNRWQRKLFFRSRVTAKAGPCTPSS